MLVCFYMVGPKFNPNVFIYSYHIETHLTYSALQLTGVQNNVFIYSYHIETHSPEWTLPEPTVGSVFLYGRGTGTRTLIDRLKAGYSSL